MVFYFCLGVIIEFSLPGFWGILQWISDVILQHRNREENKRVPVEQDEDQGEAFMKLKKLVNQGNRKAAYGIIILDRLKLIEGHDIS